MMASLVLSRVLGLLRDTVMASKFGIGLDTDAYRIAVTIPDMLFFLIAGGGMSSAFIPVFSELIHTNREKDAWKLFGVVVTLTSIVFAPGIAHFMGHGKPESIMPEVIAMSRIMLPAQFAFLIGGILFGTLYARQRFAAPGLAPNIYNVGIILGAVLISNYVHPGIAGMAWGALVGAVVGNLVMPFIVMVRLGGHFKPSLDIHAVGVKKTFQLMLPVILGFSLPSVVGLITQKFASSFEGGINTALQLSTNLMQAPQGIFGQSLALAAFPALSQFFAVGRMDMYRGQLTRSLRTVIYLSTPASALMLALAPQIVSLLYGYGRASKETSLEAVVICLQIFSLGVFAWCCHPVLMRGFFSVHKTVLPIILSTGMTAGFIGGYYVFRAVGLGYLALPASSTVCAILLAAILWIALDREIKELDLRGVLVTLFKSLVGSAAMGGLAYGTFFLLHPVRKLALGAEFLLICIAAGWLYYFITRALNMPESEYVTRAMNRINRKRSAEQVGS
jgi:putative peptidoglycan lipid II flippase